MAERICLYLDFASPYACFAIDAADRLAAAHGREIV
jgi:2-hydroxychromene-2-carboxylate isomerase